MKPLPLAGPGVGSTVNPPPPDPMECRICEMTVARQPDGLCRGCKMMVASFLGFKS